jgi:phosphoribosyl 1,2-cyclic phosphodiesterase
MESTTHTSEPISVIFWGTRGQISAPKSDQIVFGTHTTCIEIKNGAESLLFDAGFGIGRYSDSLSNKTGNYHLFFTHFHWDHVQGIGYFIPIFLPNTHLHMYSPWSVKKLQRQLNYYFDYSFGPFRSIDDENLKSQRYFHSLDQEETILVNGFEITHFLNNHEGNCYGYAIARNGKKIALLTDHAATRPDSYEIWGNDYDFVIHDAQFTDQEYRGLHGLGHSTFTQAIENAMNLGAKTVLLTHHEPLRTDAEMFVIEKKLQDQYPNCQPIIAREQVVYRV